MKNNKVDEVQDLGLKLFKELVSQKKLVRNKKKFLFFINIYNPTKIFVLYIYIIIYYIVNYIV